MTMRKEHEQSTKNMQTHTQTVVNKSGSLQGTGTGALVFQT